MQTFCFSTIAILFTVVFGAYLLVAGRLKNVSDGVLLAGLAAATMLELFDLQAWLRPAEWSFWRRGALFAEALLPAIWLLFGLTFARTGGLRQIPQLPRLLLLGALAFPLLALLSPFEGFYYSPDFADERLLFLGRPGFFFCLGLVLYLLYALMQLERTLAALPRHARWQGKFEMIGVGALLAIYLVFFSQGLLYHALDMNLLPARSLALSAAVTLMAFSRLQRGEAPRIHISHEMAFRSVVVLVVGGYLFTLGLLGEGMRHLAPPTQRALLTMAALAGGIGVIAVLLSETMRRKIKVVLHKNFYQNKYDYRDHWLRFTHRVGATRDGRDLQQAILTVFGESFAVEETILYLRDPDGGNYRAAAAHGRAPPVESFAGDNSLVFYFAATKWIFSSRDDNREIWRENRSFLEDCAVSFIVPLYFDQGLEGFITLGRPIDRWEDYTYEDFDLMKLLAAQAASALSGSRLTDQLAEARELAAIGKVSAFVLHDLKNMVSSLALTVENARHCLNNAEFRADMFSTLDDNVLRMKNLIARLQGLEEKPTLDRQPCDLAAVVREGARLAGDHGIQLSGGPTPACLDVDEIRKVALNLLLNARESGNASPVQVEVGGNGMVWFRVRDAGCGMSEEFIRQRLFRPFATTKRRGIGIGLYQCKHIVEAHGGGIEVRSTPGHGSEFTVRLPSGLEELCQPTKSVPVDIASLDTITAPAKVHY